MNPQCPLKRSQILLFQCTTNLILTFFVGLLMAFGTQQTFAEDWGSYAIIPASAPNLVLEAEKSGADEGTIISIGKPTGTANQKWIVTPNANKSFSIKPTHASGLVLAAAQGGTKLGTRIVLESDKGEPWQQWDLKKHESGVYSLIPRHTTEMGLDHLGGKQTPGAQIDLWTYNANDQHLHWIIKPLAGTLGSSASGASEAASTYLPPEIKAEDLRSGEIKSFLFSESKIFPGTNREVTVFIPAQYDSLKPACVYVKTDGYNPHEKLLLETMIATKEMPVTIGVFVRPGDLVATVKNTLGRRNRCFEYDGMGDNNVRFLVEELLPFIATKYDLKMSTAGNDRCIAGGSSGGIAAFNAAWERPDAFSRVYANSGSFVAFRGGHEFPTLVRKFEAKPIRSYLTTGTRDMENCAGDWFLIDQEMDKALKFSGYDYQFRSINGGHVASYYDNFQEAMSYLWRDWPNAVKAGPSAPRAQEILLPQETWQLVSDVHHNGVGPTCNAEGEVFFADVANNKVHKIDLDGQVKLVLADAAYANSLTFGADGQMYAVSSKTGRVTRYDATGQGKLVVDGIHGHHMIATPSDGLYITTNNETLKVTDEAFMHGKYPASTGSVWFVENGKKTQVDTGIKLATGLAYRPDQWLLSVADGHSKWVYSYQMNADGSLTNKERFFWLHVADGDDDAGSESVCFAKHGQMFVATRWGIQVCADDGPSQVIIPTPDRARVTGVCFGGRDLDTLFAFCGTKIWKRKVKVHGVGAFTPWTSVRPSSL